MFVMALPAQRLVINAWAAITGHAPNNVNFAAHVGFIQANGEAAYISFVNSVARDIPVATLASNLLTNLGLTQVFTQAEAVAYLNAHQGNLGGAIVAAANFTLNYVSNPAFANNAQMLAARDAWANTATNALNHSTNLGSVNATPLTGEAGVGVPPAFFALTTGHDTATANVFQASQTRHWVDGKGPTLNPGDVLTGTAGRTDNKLIINDLTPDATQNNLPAGITLNNIQIVELDSAANTAAGGLRTRDFASVNQLEATTQGAGGADLYIAGNANFGTATKVTLQQLSFANAAGVRVDGGHDVTVTANGGAGVRVGNQNLTSVPTAQQVATGVVDVTLHNTGTGGINIFGGSSVKATISSSSNSGAIHIGNTAANTGNTLAGAIANTTGNVTVQTAGTGATTVFGGANVTVTNTSPGGSNGAVGAITVGDVNFRAASNLPTGNVAISQTNAIAFNGLAGSANNNVVNGAIAVHGGNGVSITTNGANAISVGQVGNAARENALNPSGAVTVTNTGVETAAAAGSIRITGGTNVSVTTTGSDVSIGRNVNAVTDAASNPSGNVTVTQTMNGAGLQRSVTVDGGVAVTVNAMGQNVAVGTSAASAPSGAVVVNQADIFTGNTNAVLNGTNPGDVTVNGGTTVTVNTTGGHVTVGGVVAGVNTVPSAAVNVTNTFGGVGADAVTVRGGTTVNINTTQTSGDISVGAGATALNAAGTALRDANLAPTGDVTIVNRTVSGAVSASGTGEVDVLTNGARTVHVTGGDVDSIVDVQSTLATGGAGAGRAVGTSTLQSVVISNQVADGTVAIRSDALTSLTVTNQRGIADNITITNNTAGHALTITQGGNSNASSTVRVVAENAGHVTIRDNGTASTQALQVDAAKATGVTINNAAAATIKLDQVASDIATVTLQGAGATTLQGTFGTANLSKALIVDASAATGNVTAALALTTENGKAQEYRGSNGVDTVTISTNASGWGDAVRVDGGNGNADVLVANYAAAGTDVALGNAASVRGFEVLRLGTAANSAGGNYDAAGFSTLQVGAVAGDVTLSGAATGLTLALQANTGSGDRDVTVIGANYAATNTAMTLNITAALTDANTGVITAHGVETLNINPTANSFLEFAGQASHGVQVVNIGGTANLELKAETGGITSINAAANTGATVDVTRAEVANSDVTFTGGAARLHADGSNDFGTVRALVTLEGSAAPHWAAGLQAAVTIGSGNNSTTYTYTAPAAGATAAAVAAALAAAINANAAVGDVARVTAGAGVNTAGMATQSGGNIVLSSSTQFEVRTTENSVNGTIADSLLGGQQLNVITVSGAAGVGGQTLIATINGVNYTFTSAGADTAAQGAAGLAAAITAGAPAGIASAVAVGNTVLITSQLGQTNRVDESGTWAAGSTIEQHTNMTTVNNLFVTGAGGGVYKTGLGGSFNTVTDRFGSGSETVNLTASAARVDTLILEEGAIVTDNGARGGVTGFTVGSQGASDTLVFRNAADSGTQVKTIVANAVTGVVNTLNNAANMAAVFDSTGALHTKLGNLTYSISNGVITFGATGGSSLAQFTVNELINAAQLIVSSSTTGGVDRVAAFSHGGRSYVVASDTANTLFLSTGAGSHTDNVVVELLGVPVVRGFGSTFGANTIVSDTVANRTNATIDLAALAANSVLDYTGFAIATLNNLGANPTANTSFNNLAAAAELRITGATTGSMGFLETTQVGAAGSNSLTVTMQGGVKTIERLTTNGDALVRFNTDGGQQVVSHLLDATNTMNTVQVVTAGAGGLTLRQIGGTALTTVDLTGAAGPAVVNIGAAASVIAQNNLTFNLRGAEAVVGNEAVVFTSGTGNRFVQGLTGDAEFAITATGAGNVFTLGNGGNTITANGAGNTISVGTGSNTIVATGAGTTFNVASGAAGAGVNNITVGSNATVNIGTANVANAGAETIHVNAAVTGGTVANFASTTISFAAGVAAVGTVIDFDNAAGVTYTLLGTNAANSQVNVASATSLGAALNMAANHTLLVRDQGTAAATAALAANTAEITWFQFGGNTYVVAMVNDTAAAVQQTALDANDIVVTLVGLHDLTGSNFDAVQETLTL